MIRCILPLCHGDVLPTRCSVSMHSTLDSNDTPTTYSIQGHAFLTHFRAFDCHYTKIYCLQRLMVTSDSRQMSFDRKNPREIVLREDGRE